MSIKDFQILEKVGDGSYSSVFKVKRVIDNGIYALKKVKLEQLSNREIENAVNEVRFLASVRHPNIICYKEAFYDMNSRSLCIVMQYADGGDLLQKIFEYKRNGNQFTEQYIWDVFIQVAKGLQALHQLKILHRDIKSANVFLSKGNVAKLGDFNVSKVLKKGMMCQTQTGTPYYASPEVWKDQPYDTKSDIWSLGCVLYEFINLKPPFRARDMDGLFKKILKGYYSKISRSYSDDLTEILKLLINPDSQKRISCNELLGLPLIKSRGVKKRRDIEIEDKSALIRTIKFSKNINYLTEKLPKPNYSPLRLKSLQNVNRSVSNINIDKKKKIDLAISLPKIKNLRKSQIISSSKLKSERSVKKARYENAESLPKIKNSRSKPKYLMISK